MKNETIELYFDGCSKGNPGQSGAGAKIGDISLCEYIGIATNNVAEYKGLILGLKYCVEHIKDIKLLKIKGDSMLIINHMTGKYKVKSPHLLPLYNEAKELIKMIDNHCIEFMYIPREKNKDADYLANLALKHILK
jgi:ribonuclease HI